jgi:hypothetical protein
MGRPNITLTIDQTILDDYKQRAREESARTKQDVNYQDLMRTALASKLRDFKLAEDSRPKKGKE